jgi:hypothetical protein
LAKTRNPEEVRQFAESLLSQGESIELYLPSHQSFQIVTNRRYVNGFLNGDGAASHQSIPFNQIASVELQTLDVDDDDWHFKLEGSFAHFTLRIRGQGEQAMRLYAVLTEKVCS